MTTPTTRAELAPCPFCGHSDSLEVQHLEGTTLHPAQRIHCDYCGAATEYTSGDHVFAWNSRAAAPVAAPGGTTPMRHPIQPLDVDDKGVIRFRKNNIIDRLVRNGTISLNTTATFDDVTPDDHMQLAMLIGYSLSGFGSLSYVTDAVYDAAEAAAPGAQPAPSPAQAPCEYPRCGYPCPSLPDCVDAEQAPAQTLRTVAEQVLADMRAQGVLIEWQTALEEALNSPAQAPAVDVGLLEYRGNSVSHIHGKMTAYRSGIDDAWTALKRAGIRADGNTSVAMGIDRLAALASQPAAQPLSDEQIGAIFPSAYVGDSYVGYSRTDLCKLARAIERAHGIVGTDAGTGGA